MRHRRCGLERHWPDHSLARQCARPLRAVTFDIDPPKRPFRLQVPRLLLLAAIVLLTIVGFQWHFGRMADRFEAQTLIRDETTTLAPEQMDLLRQTAIVLRDGYGLTLRVVMRHGAVELPVLDAKSVFIGLDTATGQGVVVLPPLLTRALPPELAARLAGPYFEPYFAADAWPQGLMDCLRNILEALDDHR